MASPDIQRIMKTCLASKANEIRLVAGRPPLLRFFSEGVREIQIAPQTPEDIIAPVIDSMIPLGNIKGDASDRVTFIYLRVTFIYLPYSRPPPDLRALSNKRS